MQALFPQKSKCTIDMTGDRGILCHAEWTVRMDFVMTDGEILRWYWVRNPVGGATRSE
jgi:hypothetical protein